MGFLRAESRESIFLAEGSTTIGSSMFGLLPPLVVTLGWLLLLWNSRLDDLRFNKSVQEWI